MDTESGSISKTLVNSSSQTEDSNVRFLTRSGSVDMMDEGVRVRLRV